MVKSIRNTHHGTVALLYKGRLGLVTDHSKDPRLKIILINTCLYHQNGEN